MHRTLKKLLTVLILTQISYSASLSLEGIRWANIDYPSAFILFGQGILQIKYRCLTVEGEYINGGGNMRIHLNERATLCTKDDTDWHEFEYYEQFLSLLSHVSRCSIEENGYLHLITDDGNDLFLQEIALPLTWPDALLGKWYSNNSDSHITFKGNGEYDLYDGCNSGWGRYGAANDSIFFTLETMTLRACDLPGSIEEIPTDGALDLFDNSFTITSSSATYVYRKLSLETGSMTKIDTKYTLHSRSFKDEKLFNLKGCAVRTGKGNYRTPISTGIFMKHDGTTGRSSVILTGDREK